MNKDFEISIIVDYERCREQGFKHSIFGELRIIMRKDEPWFVLKEVCKTLDIKNNATSNFDFLEGGVDNIEVGVVTGKKKNGDDAYQVVSVTIINEANLYSVIFKSNKPNAKEYRRWVYEEVLPSIRKTGKYVEGEQENGCFSIQEFAGHFCNHSPLKLGQNKVFEILRDNGVLTKNNLPYRQYIEEGTLSTSVSVSPLGYKSYRTIITPKGIAKILKIVSEHYLDEPKNNFNPNQYMIDFETGTTILRGTFEALKYTET